MAGQTSAILRGFDYQHLLSWYHLLSLKKGRNVSSVKLENSAAAHVDDLTVEMTDGSIDFYQIKYHVSGGHYSITEMLSSAKGKSLMEKFWVTWNKLKAEHPGKKIRLILYSNWFYHPEDQILMCINGDNGHLGEQFFSATPGSLCGQQREAWKQAHSADDVTFNEFTKAISFQLGKDVTEQLKEVIAERMLLYGLKHDENAMLVAVGIVKDWIKDKTEDITLPLLEEAIQRHDLYLPVNTEKAAAVYFVTVKNRKFDLQPDFILDWRHYFQESGGLGGHELIEQENWNKVLLPELRSLEDKINNEVTPTLIRARGFARLSPWFAFGHTFSEVAGYTIEVSQQDKLWRTDELPSPSFTVVSENGEGEQLATGNKVVAVGISVTGSLSEDVRKYIRDNGNVDALLLLRPSSGPGPACFQSGGDVAAFSRQAKTKIRDFVKRHQAGKLLIFYFGPLSGACFIGHQLNAVCKQIQVMENTAGGGYSESFTLL